MTGPAVGPIEGTSLVAFVLLGALGSVHCLGMCGPLLTLYAERMPSEGPGLSRFELRQHALFNAGRTVSYAAVGATMGALGAVLFDAAGVVAVGNGVRAVVGVTVGVVIVAAGVGYALGGTASMHSMPVLGDLFGTVNRLLAPRVDRLAGGFGIVGLGLVHGLLPCPLLYPAFLYAFARGSPIEGGLALAALGLGTFPTLFVYGAGLGSLNVTSRRHVHRVLGVAFVLLGTVPLSHGLGLVGVSVPHVALP
ncbi:MAG: sulfite exporter TauE/SafE family protein [Halobacteriota archaeon]